MISNRSLRRRNSKRFLVVFFVTAFTTVVLVWIMSGGDVSPITKARKMVSSDSIIGLEEADLVSLFGKPNESEYFRDWDAKFVLGPEEGYISIDDAWLVVRYGKLETVVEAAVVTD